MPRLGLKTLVVVASVLLGAGSAQATPTTALYLTMDGSGSIDSTEFTTQVTAYVSALNAVFGAHPGLYGQVAIGGGIFGGTFSGGPGFVEYFAPQAINDATTLGTLTTAIANLDPGRAGVDTSATAIGDAITASANSLTAYETSLGSNLKLIIDVTTDGANNEGSDPATVAGGLTPTPIDAVNCLGITAAANCTFVAGAGTNFGTVSFAGLQSALVNKLVTEFEVPEPGSMALLGIGLAALGLVGRRRRPVCA